MVEGAIYKARISCSRQRGTILVVFPMRMCSSRLTRIGTWGMETTRRIWFAQSIGFEFRIIDHLSSSLQSLAFYVKALKERPYIYGKHYLPHDAKAHELGTGKSIEEQLRVHFPSSVFVTPKLSITDGIAAVRAIFGRCWFDREKCADGLQSLRHYRYDRDEHLGSFKREPLHDWASHDADAFRTLGVSIKQAQKPQPQRPPARPVSSWS